MYIVLSLLCNMLYSWELIDTSFIDESISSQEDWNIMQSCSSTTPGSFSTTTCTSNSQNMVVLDVSNSLFTKNYQIATTKIILILDIYFNQPDSTNPPLQIDLLVYDGQSNPLFADAYISSQRQLSRVCMIGADYMLDTIRINTNSINTQVENFKIEICMNGETSDQIFIKNILLYGIRCNQTCKSCKSINYCLTCYTGTPTDGKCNCSEYQFYRPQVGCISICNRIGELADENKICQPDSRISQLGTYLSSSAFITTSPFSSVDGSGSIAAGFDCDSNAFAVVKFTSTRGMQYNIGTTVGLSRVRIRCFIFIYSFSDTSNIQFCLNGDCQASISQSNGEIIMNNITPYNFESCTNLLYYYQVETVLTSTTNSVLIKFYGNSGTGFSWAIKNIMVDKMVCALNCQTCFNLDLCQACQGGYHLFNGQCITTYPIYTNNGIDYQNIIPISGYLLKSFFDLTYVYTYLFDSTIEKYTNSLITTYSNKIVLGGPLVWNNGKIMQRYSSLLSHYAITIMFNITYGDDFNGQFILSIDNNVKQTLSRITSASDTNFLGKQASESINYNYFYGVHSQSDLEIDLECKNTLSILDSFCAISEYFIIVHYCLSNCAQCITYSTCDLCDTNFELVNNACICQTQLFRELINNNCVCASGYEENPITLLCQPKCGDGILISPEEECDNGNAIMFNGCFMCQLQCGLECSICIKGLCWMCNDGFELISNDCILIETPLIKYQSDEQEQMINCPQNCQNCVLGICYQCVQKYELDYFNNKCVAICGNGFVQDNEECDIDHRWNMQIEGCQNCKCAYGYKIINTICTTICGDGYLTLNEECDDGNNIQDDGCYLCKLECQNCDMCVVGVCSICTSGYYQDDDYICSQTNCGDGIVVGNEQCDDGNFFIDDGCNNCECEVGFKNESSTCNAICGDGLVVLGEQCDDSNQIQYDGCYNCLYDCNSKCSNCQLNICKECQYGYTLSNNQCINVCGDGMLNIDTEQCDDSNQLARDGCYQCQIEAGFTCTSENLLFVGCSKCKDSNCIKCQQDGTCTQCSSNYLLYNNQCVQCNPKCIECKDTPNTCTKTVIVPQCDVGQTYDSQQQKCISLCGDGIVSSIEECDDSNQINYDGCNDECNIEDGYLYDQNNNTLIKTPQLNVETIESANYKIVADYNQQTVNCSGTTVSIDQFSQSEYNYTVITNNDSSCDVALYYYKNVDTYNKIHLFIRFQSQYKLGSNRILFEYIELVIVPVKWIYSTDSEKQQGQSVATTQSAVTSSLFVLGPSALTVGGFNFIWAIMDMLSWINNFYFLNVDYPESVRELFLQSSWIHMIGMSSNKKFNKPTDYYYFQAPSRFEDKNKDPLFINSIQVVVIIWCIIVLIYGVCRLIMYIIDKKYGDAISPSRTMNLFKLDRQETQIIQRKQTAKSIRILRGFVKTIYNICNKFCLNFWAIFFKVFMMTYLDMTLAITLQLTNQQQSQYIFVKFNIILAGLTLIGIIFLLSLTYKISQSHQQLLDNSAFQRYYLPFYNDLCTDQGMIFAFMNPFKKTAFIISIVILYDFPIFQTSLCFIICLQNIIRQLYKNPYKTKHLFVLYFIPECGVLFIVGVAVLLAFQDKFNIFSQTAMVGFGWIIALCIFFSIAVQIGCLLKSLFCKIWIQLKQFILNKK